MANVAEVLVEPAQAARPREEPWVVVVEDHASLRTLLRCLLECEGCVVNEFSDARDALEYLKMSHRMPTLVVTDLNLRGMSGLELALELRQKERFATLPIVLTTGGVTRLAGVAHLQVMPKPVDPDALLAYVRELHAGPLRAP